jgi:hypothetical protein
MQIGPSGEFFLRNRQLRPELLDPAAECLRQGHRGMVAVLNTLGLHTIVFIASTHIPRPVASKAPPMSTELHHAKERALQDLLRSMGEDPLARQLSATTALRLKRELERRAVEDRQTYSLTYSTQDVERLARLSAGDSQALARTWNAGFFETAFRVHQRLLWIGTAVTAWFLLRDHEALRAVAGGLLADVPSGAFLVVGLVMTLAVALTSPMAFRGFAAPEHWEGYRAGYEDGLRQGVNRALGLTREDEQRMQSELRRAELGGWDPENK